MIPKRIVLENFLSFGSPETEIVFSDDEPLWVLGGRNGVGKSAVFDAMTYSLYGEHRGGASDHASLVRHGANGFRVAFEFEFNGVDYQITRNRPLSGRPTQSLKQWADGGWTKSVPLPPASGRQDPIKLWTERTLGIGFAAFKASVLLRQGESDAIITAGGAERLNILKKIIGLEAYEALSDKVHAQARKCKEHLEDLRIRRDALTQVAEEEVRAAQGEFEQKEEGRSKSHEALAKAVERVPLARQWVKLDEESKMLNKQILAADARANDAERIRQDCARLNDLVASVPVFRHMLKLREDLVTVGETLTERQAGAKHLADAINAKQLREEIGRDEKFINAADAVMKLRNELVAFDPNLDDQLKAARERVQATTDALTSILEAKAAATGLLKQAMENQQNFATVGVGVKCSLCGQEVTARHAKQERDRLATEIKQLERKVRESESKEETGKKVKKAATNDLSRLSEVARKRDSTAQQLATKEQTLNDLGVTAEPGELRRQLSEKTAEVGRLEAEVGDQSRADLPTLKNRLTALERLVQVDKQNIASMQGQQSSLLGQLSTNWNGQVEKLDTKAVKALDAEQQRLTSAGVLELFRQLEQDTAQRDRWGNRLAEMSRQIGDLPIDGRVFVDDAEKKLEAAKQAAASADNARDAAKKKADDLAGAAERYHKLVKEVAEAERRADLHRKLDELLGKAGLQRELVRTAEREIVRLANDTVQNLSNGDLTVELDDGADGDDEAFALRVRLADGPTPIGVNYLSGSQKFRVAVSVALAIGRFAAGQSRPLESVIIDEGFGSLDRDGLCAAATELNRLRQYLRRIILVSHQEEFAERFPVVIRLTHGTNGTTAAAVRK